MHMTRRLGRSRGERGAGMAAVELAVVLPVLLTLILGCVDLGRFAYTYAAVNNAARAGAAYAVMNSFRTAAEKATWQNNVQKAARDEIAQQADANQLTVTTTWVPPTPTGLWQVEVTTSYPFQTLVPWLGIPATVDLKGGVVMRVIR